MLPQMLNEENGLQIWNATEDTSNKIGNEILHDAEKKFTTAFVTVCEG
jgi:hypothetical protein